MVASGDKADEQLDRLDKELDLLRFRLIRERRKRLFFDLVVIVRLGEARRVVVEVRRHRRAVETGGGLGFHFEAGGPGSGADGALERVEGVVDVLVV
jgi:hypothetical protein